jgi:hypothetical protein
MTVYEKLYQANIHLISLQMHNKAALDLFIDLMKEETLPEDITPAYLIIKAFMCLENWGSSFEDFSAYSKIIKDYANSKGLPDETSN